MEKTIKTQRKIILVLISLVVILSAYIGYYVLYSKKYDALTIEELNKGASIDFAYINKMNEAGLAINENFEMCNTYLSKDLKGELTNADLAEISSTYINKIMSKGPIIDQLIEMKKNRSKEFAKFKYVKVYKPEWE